MREEFEDTKGVIRIRKSKENRLHDQKEKGQDKQRSTKRTHKTKDRVMFKQRTHNTITVTHKECDELFFSNVSTILLHVGCVPPSLVVNVKDESVLFNFNG
jgi:hypothetical protein